MKVGMRKPSLKKSLSAKTTGKAKRAVKKAVIPGYGKKGSGFIKNPSRSIKNKVYRKTTFGISDLTNGGGKKKSGSTLTTIVVVVIVLMLLCMCSR